MSGEPKNTEKKAYLGRPEQIPTGLGVMYKIGFHISDLQNMLDNINERDYVNIMLKVRPDNTCYIQYDGWDKSKLKKDQQNG